MDKPTVSILIATFNSEKTLPLVLESIRRQTFPKAKIEVILIDGGSKDKTLKIGKKFHCRIIVNPKTEPVFGKFLGYLKAKGKYAMYLDHDEVIENKKDIAMKLSALESDHGVKMVVGSGYKNPKGYPFINDYVNDFGDPFSFFMDRLSRNSSFFINTMKNRYRIVSDNKIFSIFEFSRGEVLPPFELVQGGSMLDIRFLKKQFPETLKKYELMPHIFFLVCTEYPFIAVIKKDPLIHYSAETIRKYLTKINWRIKNNIYHIQTIGKAGFIGREKYQPSGRKLKKYIFLFYAFSVAFPLLDSFYLVITRKKVGYFLHLPLVLYTGVVIMFHRFLKLVGLKPGLRSYDESKVIT